MRKFLVLLILIFANLYAFGQQTLPTLSGVGNPTAKYLVKGLLSPDLQFKLPATTACVPYFDSAGSLRWYGGLVQVHNGNVWTTLAGGGGGGTADSTVFATLYRVDTAKRAIRGQIPTNNNQLTNGAGYISGETDSIANAKTVKVNSGYGISGGSVTPQAVGTNPSWVVVLDTPTVFPAIRATISSSAITALTGDVTATGPGAAAATLATVNTAGTYNQVVTNAKGLTTSGSYVVPNYRTGARVATTASLTATYGGTGVGATLTNATTQAALNIDGIAVSVGDRVCVWLQNGGFQYQNGVYSVTNVGSASTNWVLTRTTDFDGSATGTIVQGNTVNIAQGTANAGLLLIQNAIGPFTMGTTPITFIANGASLAGAVTGVLSVANGGTGLSAFTTGSIPFMGATTFGQDNTNFFWDATNKYLGLGTNAPANMLDLRAAANVTMATFSQAWTGSGSPVGFIIAISDASSGTGKLISVRGGSSGSTERFYIDRNGNGFMQNSLSCPNLYGLNNSTPLGIRNQTSSTSTINMDIVSIGRDRGVTNVMQSTAPSGTTNWVAVYPTYAQGTGATTINNDILVDRTETTIGTGTEQNLINLKVAGTSKFKVSNAGVMTVGGGVAQGGGIKHIRQTTGSIATASSALITITWATTFADANYTVVATVLDATTASASLEVVHIETQSASAITVRVKNTAAGSLTGTLNVIAIHD